MRLFLRSLFVAVLVAVAVPVLAQSFATSTMSCAILTDGRLKCWGFNDDGALGHGHINQRGDDAGEMGANLAATDLGTGRTATDVVTGNRFVCARLDDGTAKCWGHNLYGQLGQGDQDVRGDHSGEMGDALPPIAIGTGRTVEQLGAGDAHACARLDDGSVKCWGLNTAGQLGVGNQDNRGDAAGEMGDALPAVDLGPGRTAMAIAVGGFHTCALLDNQTVKCWGRNGSGQLGQGDNEHRGDGPGEMGNGLPKIDLGTNRTAKRLVAGTDHTCALLDDATVKCWGGNPGGQLGLGGPNHRGDQAGEMGDALPAVALGTGETAQGLAAGQHHTCALLTRGQVKCWGRNGHGELGLGDTESRGDQAGEMGDALPVVGLGTGRTVRTLAAGQHRSTCALLDDDSLKCWGHNLEGQLGQGDSQHRGDDPGEMGDALPALVLDGVVVPTEATVPYTAPEVRWTGAHPVRMQAKLALTVSVAQTVTADVLDLLGRHIVRLYHGPAIPATPLRLRWTTAGQAAGMYFVRVQGSDGVVVRPLVVQR